MDLKSVSKEAKKMYLKRVPIKDAVLYLYGRFGKDGHMDLMDIYKEVQSAYKPASLKARKGDRRKRSA